jgi:hypothetical protein
MKQLYEIKRKLSLLLLIGIIILCIGFIFINCGKGPQSKIIHADSSQCAVDFSDITANTSNIFLVSNELLNRQGSEVTIEAWVKRKTGTLLRGSVLSRHSSEGAMLWVKDNEPKFAIRSIVNATSTDFIVNSNVSLAENTWTHLAGVLIDEDHSSVHSACDVEGLSTSIGLDASKKAYIGYHDAVNGSVKYITNASGSWVKSIVASSGKFTSLVVETENKAHVAYHNSGPNGDLFYAKPSSTPGVWLSPETVDNSVDVDGSDIPDGDFTDPEDISVNVGKYNSIKLDSSNKAYISYYDDGVTYASPNGDLKYATNASGSWVTTTVDSTGDVGKYTSIAVDSSNKAYISYYDVTNGDLKYATNASGSWVTTTVDSTGDVGKHTSIAVDSSNKAYISYYDVTNGDLKYATNASGSWVTTAVDSTGDVGKHTSIAVDSSNKAYISYYNDIVTNGYPTGDLKYATNASGSWVTTTVDSTGDVGKHTSIAVDSSNKAYISYYDFTNGDLKYATNASGSWAAETVDSSLEVARSETPHLDIYVNGEYKNCASTGSRPMSSDLTCAADELGEGVCSGDSIGIAAFIGSAPSDGTAGTFNGIIDEPRYWTTARTQAQIMACMNQELVSSDSGVCGINNADLASYMRLNECKGAAPSDWTGLGSGSKESPSGTPEWDGGWVNGAPVTRKD